MAETILPSKENISITVIKESPAHNPSAPPMLDNMSNPLYEGDCICSNTVIW